MFNTICRTLEDLEDLLQALKPEEYTGQCAALDNGTIGQHTRHVAELLECLLKGYDQGIVCYDRRERNKVTETDIVTAKRCLEQLRLMLARADKPLLVTYELNEAEVTIQSSYFRELMYNLEHCIHHQALIRVAVFSLTSLTLPAHFGVAPSTLQYRSQQCAQ